MNVDIVAYMIVYCVATVAFYMLGAGILHSQGLVPKANDMIPVLSKMYTQTLGTWSLPLFYVGAIATLYGTIFAATAGNSRVLADVLRVAGVFPRGDYAARCRMRNLIIWFHLIVPVLLYWVLKSPVTMVKAGGVAQACMLPPLAIGALYMRHRGLPKSVEPTLVPTAGLWIAAILISSLMAYYVILTLR